MYTSSKKKFSRLSGENGARKKAGGEV